MKDECAVSTTREQHGLEKADTYWVECVRTDDHDCTTEPRIMCRVPRKET